MTTNRHVTLFHSPNSRSTGVLILLEELRADHSLELIDLQAGDQRRSGYLAINPMGKVPALRHGDAIVTELVAIFIYLADLYPEVGLAPPVGDPLRGPYLRWIAFYGSTFEPAIIDRSMKRDPGPRASSPYGDFDSVQAAILAQLQPGPYLLGSRFTAADVLWGISLDWMTQFGLFPPAPLVQEYVARMKARPAVQRAQARDAELVRRLEKLRQGAGAQSGAQSGAQKGGAAA
ncbi:MAG: glutathione S-transferase family protein [Steroidobacteraceae bacterium]